jgi:hypothetical protein
MYGQKCIFQNSKIAPLFRTKAGAKPQTRIGTLEMQLHDIDMQSFIILLAARVAFGLDNEFLQQGLILQKEF